MKKIYEVAIKAMQEGRGSAKNMPLDELKSSEVVVFWGRGLESLSKESLAHLDDKTIVVISSSENPLSKSANLHVKLEPKRDFELALMLCRFLYIENSHDELFTQKYATNLEDFYELTQNFRVKMTLDRVGVSLGTLGELLSLLQNKKVALLCGEGLYGHKDSEDTLRVIDALAVMLGLFGKKGCGVNFLCDTTEELAYKEGFDTDDGEFVFLEDIYLQEVDISTRFSL
ncbi:MAG: molybdopterin-dependent oxidoreductase [Sulfurimonas sp.]